MTRILAALCLVAPTIAFAQQRLDATRLPCGQVAALVQSRGAVVIGTGPYSYDRYVSGAQFCVRPEITVPAWIGTADAAQCFVGYLCRERQPRFGG
jgi:hypothetical protein